MTLDEKTEQRCSSKRVHVRSVHLLRDGSDVVLSKRDDKKV